MTEVGFLYFLPTFGWGALGGEAVAAAGVLVPEAAGMAATEAKLGAAGAREGAGVTIPPSTKATKHYQALPSPLTSFLAKT